MTGIDPFRDVNPVYRTALAAASSSRRHEGRLDGQSSLARVEVTAGPLCLAVLVDSATHVIKSASYWNASSAIERGLLEALCDVLIDVPVREASDHAVIFVEHSLRDPSRPRPVPGIVMPKNADPIFLPLVQITRQLASRYEEMAGAQTTENFFERPPSATWAATAPDARLSRIQTVLDALSAENGVESEVTVLRIDDLVRVTVGFGAAMAGPLAQHRLMQLERGLKARVEPSLQLYLKELKDRNVIRALVTPKETA